MSQTTIRVNAGTLGNHIGERVRIVGEVIDSSSVPHTIKTTDSRTIPIHPSADGSLEPERFQSKWVEVTGIAQSDKSIQEEFTVPIPNDINREAWDQMAELIERNREIFY